MVTVSLGEVLLLLMVTVVEELVAPTGAAKFVIVCGVTPTVALPSPFSVTRCGLVELSSVISSVADLGPEARGVNVTDTVQLLLA